MKPKLHILVILLLLPALLNAQNLVPNPSFEECDTCPFADCQIHLANGWHACSGTPDYFNECAYIDDYSVPNNINGYQIAKNGNAYASILSYTPYYNNGREHICTELIEPLEVGREYYVSIYISLINRAEYATNKIGVLFTNQNNFLPPCYEGNSENFEIQLTPSNYANVYTDEIIVDTANWINISGWFTADSAYNYMMIGNFFDDENTNKLFVNYGTFGAASYYIDNIYVGKDSISSDEPIQERNKSISAYPNPFSESSRLKIANSDIINNYSINLYDITGKEQTKKVSIRKQNNNEFLIKRNKLSNGIYFLKIEVNNKVYNSKLVLTN